MAIATVTEERKITGVTLELSVEEAETLNSLLYRHITGVSEQRNQLSAICRVMMARGVKAPVLKVKLSQDNQLMLDVCGVDHEL
jgi:ABC-type sugar transport system ATPase subunit